MRLNKRNQILLISGLIFVLFSIFYINDTGNFAYQGPEECFEVSPIFPLLGEKESSYYCTGRNGNGNGNNNNNNDNNNYYDQCKEVNRCCNDDNIVGGYVGDQIESGTYCESTSEGNRCVTPPEGVKCGIEDDEEDTQEFLDSVTIPDIPSIPEYDLPDNDPSDFIDDKLIGSIEDQIGCTTSDRQCITIEYFFDDYNWCASNSCTIQGTRNVDSNVYYSYQSTDWTATNSGPRGPSARSADIGHGESSSMNLYLNLPEIRTGVNYVYSLSFNYLVSAHPTDYLKVYIQSATGFDMSTDLRSVEIAFADGIECILGGVPGTATSETNTFSELLGLEQYQYQEFSIYTDPESKCTRIPPGDYIVSFHYVKSPSGEAGKDVAFIDNLQVNLIQPPV